MVGGERGGGGRERREAQRDGKEGRQRKLCLERKRKNTERDNTRWGRQRQRGGGKEMIEWNKRSRVILFEGRYVELRRDADQHA